MNGLIARVLDQVADRVAGTALTVATVLRCYADAFASAQHRVDAVTKETPK
ncbi:hypothetical protein [Amycolatopsis thermoflava]|uniref:hypothetical protein n=1 Tax=Amycolatopsis thermoflava TaxID=84480 RepID=UPI00041327B2|nr:hypothetical protein [Amycolatopsis thermoflava]